MMVTIIITIKLFHLFISALCAAVFLDSVNLTETLPVSVGLFLPLHTLFFSKGSFLIDRANGCSRLTLVINELIRKQMNRRQF